VSGPQRAKCLKTEVGKVLLNGPMENKLLQTVCSGTRVDGHSPTAAQAIFFGGLGGVARCNTRP
jgi:hypothetical protein